MVRCFATNTIFPTIGHNQLLYRITATESSPNHNLILKKLCLMDFVATYFVENLSYYLLTAGANLLDVLISCYYQVTNQYDVVIHLFAAVYLILP